MSVVDMRKWTATAIEIALDLEIRRVQDCSQVALSGHAEPRITLVAAFASTAQLKRICGAIARAAPEKLPGGLRITPARTRRSTDRHAIAVQPMRTLLGLQTKFIRVIEPGLVSDRIPFAFGVAPTMDEPAALFVRDFIPYRALPLFEPSYVSDEFEPMRLRAIGLTIYRLGMHGAPESVLAHWGYGDA